MDESIAIVVVLGVVFADPIADLLYAAVDPRIRYKQRGPSDPANLIDKYSRLGNYGLTPKPSVTVP